MQAHNARGVTANIDHNTSSLATSKTSLDNISRISMAPRINQPDYDYDIWDHLVENHPAAADLAPIVGPPAAPTPPTPTWRRIVDRLEPWLPVFSLLVAVVFFLVVVFPYAEKLHESSGYTRKMPQGLKLLPLLLWDMALSLL